MDHPPTPTDRALAPPSAADQHVTPEPSSTTAGVPSPPSAADQELTPEPSSTTAGVPSPSAGADQDVPPESSGPAGQRSSRPVVAEVAAPLAPTGRASWWPVAAVAVLAAAAVAVIAVAGPSTRPAVGRPAPGVAAADDAGARDAHAVAAFLAAWERSAGGTYVVRSTFERHLGGDRSMTAQVVLAQRPPDRLVGQDDSVSGRVGGRLVACASVDGDAVPCADAGPAPRWGDQVAAEVAGVRRLVSGPSPRYAVDVAADGCFALRLRVWEPAAPYGTSATFCFDPATGAPTRTEVVRPEGTDLTLATDVRPPSDADFRLPG